MKTIKLMSLVFSFAILLGFTGTASYAQDDSIFINDEYSENEQEGETYTEQKDAGEPVFEETVVEEESVVSEEPVVVEEPVVENAAHQTSGEGDYVIRRGDCLWDLSAEFYDTPWKWRDIYNANSYIRNPNLIYPFDKLFIPGVTQKRSKAASFDPEAQVVQEEKYEKEASVQKEVEEAEEPEEKDDYSRYYEEDVEVEGSLPPELSGTFDSDQQRYQENGFVVPLDWEYDGYVVGSAEKKLMISAGDLVFLDVGSGGGIEPRKRCGVYRLGERVRAKDSRKIIGMVIKKIAIIEATKDVEEEASTARVISSHEYIKKGDLVRIIN
ncbi:MAG: LysM peptidoglycan-binding domain-containing protein [bacterium]